MNHPRELDHPDKNQQLLYSRRALLQHSGGGFGGLALAAMLGANGVNASSPRNSELNGGLHHPAKVKRVIQLFMNGGVSQMDTFDYKPELEKRHGEQANFGIAAAATSTPGTLMKSPFAFARYGESGRWVSSVFPQLAKHVDDFAFLMGMKSKSNVHGPASYLQNTGFTVPGFPSMGAWISYGLGNLTEELPAFVVLPDSRGLPYNNTGNFSAGFLPAANAPTIINPNAKIPIPNLLPPRDAGISELSERDGLRLLDALNRRHAESDPFDSQLAARMQSLELAARMQLSAPEALELTGESAATLTAYGLENPTTEPFGRNCLIARRLLERGVRFVQVWSGMGGPSNNWDNHNDIPNELPYIASRVDQPISALLNDLRERGLLEDSLVVWTTEFGRMPFTQGATGRDHNGGTFVSWLAGAGIKSGTLYGSSDELGYEAVEGVTFGYDLHATILHLMGIDHERLTFVHNGIARRLTDVHGHPIDAILA